MSSSVPNKSVGSDDASMVDANGDDANKSADHDDGYSGVVDIQFPASMHDDDKDIDELEQEAIYINNEDSSNADSGDDEYFENLCTESDSRPNTYETVQKVLDTIVDACVRGSGSESECYDTAPVLANMNQIDRDTVELCFALAVTVDGAARIVPATVIEEFGQDIININGVKVAVTCPICNSIKCSGPGDHDLPVSRDQPLPVSLPYEIFLNILSNLSPQDLCNYVSPVSKSWRAAALDASLWSYLDLYKCCTISTPWINYILKYSRNNLKYLNLRGRNLNLLDVHIWSRRTAHLSSLDLSFCSNLDIKMLVVLQENCPNLQHLSLEGVKKISLEEMEVICKWSLNDINLCYCERTTCETVLYMVKNIESVRTLNINGIADTQDNVIQALALGYQYSLKHLDLDGEEMTDDGFQYLALCSKLERLTIHYTHALTDKSLPTVLNFPELQHLKIRDGRLLTSNAISGLFKGPQLMGLRELDLSECSAVVDKNVVELVDCCGRNLTSLNLSWTYLITDVSFDCIVCHCCKLEKLLLVGNKLLHGEKMLDIATYVPRLVLLDLEMCDGIDDADLTDLILEMPQLQITNYYGEILVHS